MRGSAQHAGPLAISQRRFVVKKSTASLMASAWTASRSVPSGSRHVSRKNTLPTKVHVPENMKWPAFGNIFRVACGITLAKASAAAAVGMISSALPATIATGSEIFSRLSGAKTGPGPESSVAALNPKPTAVDLAELTW